MKKTVVICFAVLIVLALSGCKNETTPIEPADNIAAPADESQNQSQPAEPEAPEALEVNYTRTGVALNWDSATESYTDNWKLLYDEMGSPAANRELIFSGASVCVIDGANVGCNQAITENKLTNGATVKVEGNEAGGKVTVVKLTLIEKGEQY